MLKPYIRLGGMLALVVTFGTGCIEMTHELEIQGDASAVYRLNYAITEQAINQFRAMFTLRRDLALAEGVTPDPDPAPLIMTFLDPSVSSIREHLQRWEENGIAIRTLRENTRSLWRDFTIVLDIEDISRLPDIPFFAQQGFSLQTDSNGQYVFSRPALVTEADSIPPAFSNQELEQIRPFLDGFNTQVRIEVPGRILSTTAGRTSMQTAIWEFAFNQRPESVHQLLQQQFYIVFQPPSGVTLPEISLSAESR